MAQPTSIRLNQSIRDEIRRNIMEAYKAEYPKPESPKSETTLMIEMATEVLLAKDSLHSKWKRAIARNPWMTGSVSKYNYLSLCKDSQSGWVQVYHPDTDKSKNSYVYWLGNQGTIRLDDTEAFPEYAHILPALKAHKKAAKPQTLAIKEWETEYVRYREEVRQVLGSVNTTKQLLEVWPKVAKFLPRSANPVKIGLPSVNVTELNRKLNL
ncbi:Nmad5 family nucleotide modification protein [Vibrio phage vB_VhaP_PG11]|nr:Nmad5 family nucleotide modification protein [Vibrio phage vB_VhaP_PG11]